MVCDRIGWWAAWTDIGLVMDQHRIAILEKQGIKVLCCWDNEVFQNTNDVLDDILIELELR
jgi:very-short-patch-repair endonuclease